MQKAYTAGVIHGLRKDISMLMLTTQEQERVGSCADFGRRPEIMLNVWDSGEKIRLHNQNMAVTVNI